MASSPPNVPASPAPPPVGLPPGALPGVAAQINGTWARLLTCTCKPGDDPGASNPYAQCLLDDALERMRQHGTGEVPLSPEDSLALRQEINRLSELVHGPGPSMSAAYSAGEQAVLAQRAAEQRRNLNNLGLAAGGLLTAPALIPRALGAPESVVEGVAELSFNVLSAVGLSGPRALSPRSVPVRASPLRPIEAPLARPAEPVAARPAEPVAARPVESAAPPAKPAEPAPAKPAESAPAKPAESAPAKPAESAPAKPAESAPARPAEEAPPKPPPSTAVKPRKLSRQQRAEQENNERIDEYLRKEGRDVQPNPEEGKPGAGRQADRIIDGKKTEYKTLTPKPGQTSGPNTIKNVVGNSISDGGQARDIIIWSRGTGLTEAQARLGIDLGFRNSRGLLDSIRVIGDGFDIKGP